MNDSVKLLLCMIFLLAMIPGQTIHINEIVSSNSTVLYDEEGNTPDWIEFFNGTTEQINLEGYGVSDDPEEPFKWVFPTVIVNPDSC